MARYIDADALREKMFHEAFEKDSQDQKWDSGCWIRYHMFENAVDSIPTADVVERKRGKWIVIMNESNITFDECKCSECGVVEYFNKGWKKFKFCPNCGAEMCE